MNTENHGAASEEPPQPGDTLSASATIYVASMDFTNGTGKVMHLDKEKTQLDSFTSWIVSPAGRTARSLP